MGGCSKYNNQDAFTSGVVNTILLKVGILISPNIITDSSQNFLGNSNNAGIWKEMGWNAIIYLAAITSIDPELYDAAKVDGAEEIRQILNITLPSIRPTIIVLLIMSIGNLIKYRF